MIVAITVSLFLSAVPFCHAARATIPQLDGTTCPDGTYLCHFHAVCCNLSTEYCSISSQGCKNVFLSGEFIVETCCHAFFDGKLLNREEIVNACHYDPAVDNIIFRWKLYCADLATSKKGSMTTTVSKENYKQGFYILIGVVVVLVGVIVVLVYCIITKKWPCCWPCCTRQDVNSNIENTAANNNCDNKTSEQEMLLDPGSDKKDLNRQSEKKFRQERPVENEIPDGSAVDVNSNIENTAANNNFDNKTSEQEMLLDAGSDKKVLIEPDQASQNEQINSPAVTGTIADEASYAKLSPSGLCAQKDAHFILNELATDPRE